MSELTWSDQPEMLESMACLFQGGVGKRSVEVRADAARLTYYVTTGNLFGSQTLRCTADSVWTTLDAIANVRDVAKLPKDVTIMEAA